MKTNSKPNFFPFKICLFFLLTLGTLTSCQKEGCTDSNAENYSPKADEDDGSCTFDRNKFIGEFTATEDCEVPAIGIEALYSYTLTIAENVEDSNQIYLFNLLQENDLVTATVTSNGFVFEHTYLQEVGSFAITGIGTYIDENNLKMELDMEVFVLGSTYQGTCSIDLDKNN